MKAIIIMFQRKIIQHQQPVILNKHQSSYRKLEKAMNEAPKEYEQIKKLIENNDIENINNKSSKKNLDKLIPHLKKT